jgi:hypothetical protein
MFSDALCVDKGRTISNIELNQIPGGVSMQSVEFSVGMTELP